MKPRFSVILLAALLAACSKPAPIATVEKEPVPRFVNFETGSNVKSLAFDGEDLWLGLANGLIRYDTRTPDRYEPFTVRSTQGLLAKGVYKVAVDRQKRKWVGTYGGGLSRYDGKEWLAFTPYGGGRITYDDAWTIYPPGSGLGDLWVYDIYFNSDGTVWVATWKGVSRFDGERFTTYTEKDGLLDKWIYAIAKDQNGHFWFGTEGGINRFDGKNWIGYTHRDGLGADVDSSSEGSSYEEGHHGRMTKENRTANPNFVLDIAVDRNNHIWVGTWGAGLSRFDGNGWTTYSAGGGTIGGNFVHALEVDSKGILWIGTDQGVTRFDGKRWKTYTASDGLQDNNVFSIAFDSEGNKWFGTWTGLSKMIAP